MEDARVARERRRQDVGERSEDRREDRADRDRPPDHPCRRRVGAVGVAGSQHPRDDHLAGDRYRVEHEREEEEELIRDLVRTDLGIAHPRENGRRDEEARVERGRADEDLAPDPHHRLHFAPARAARGRVRAEQFDDERDSHSRLRDRGSRGRAGNPPVEDVDEEELEDEIREVRDDDDLEWPPQVRDAAEVALARERDERGWKADRGDPEIRQRVVARGAVPTEPAEERPADDLAADEERESNPERRPEGLRRKASGVVFAASARRPRDNGGRPVREEVEDRERSREHRPRKAERRDLRPAEMADDRGVGKDVERLGRERAEGRQREPNNLAVVRRT